jgi:outer membrane protein
MRDARITGAVFRSGTTGMALRAGALAVGLAVTGLVPQVSRADNLVDALIGAYNTSGLLEQNRALLRAADEDVGSAVAALRPVIAWTVTASRSVTETRIGPLVANRGTSPVFTGLTADWLLFDGGARLLGVDVAKETVLATRQSLISIEQIILQRAVVAYVNVILTTENVTLRENNVRVLGEELRAAQDRFEVGEVTRTDVALAQSRLANARSNLAAARGALVNAQSEYTNAVGRKPGVLAGQPKRPARPASIEAARALAFRNHPDILAAQHQVTATELAVLQVRKALGPSVTARADLGLTNQWNSTDSVQSSSASLIFNQPIYRGGALMSQVRRTMASRDAAKANLLTVQRNVRQGVDNAFVRLEVARASIVATNERVRAAQVAFDGIREEATLGARTTLDVLTAEQELLDALTAQISALSEQSIAAYQLLAAQGLLTAEHLGLAVQIYDPTIYYNLAKNAPALQSKQSRDLDRVLQALGKR